MGRARFIVAPALLVALSGCTLLFASNLDDAVGAATDAGFGAETSVTPGAEAGADASPDASGEAGPIRGCASYKPAPKFCDDFDDGASLETKWKVNRESGDTVRDDAFAFSPPASAKVTLSSSPGCKYSRIERSFKSLAGKRFSLAFRFRPGASWGEHTPLAIELFNPNAYCAALLYVNGKDGVVTGTQVNVQSGTAADDIRPLPGAPKNETWTEIRFEATPRAGGGATHVFTFTSEDGTVTTKSLDYAQCPTWTEATLKLGFHCDGGNVVASYDDVRVDWD